jgi:hypothetical protein
MPDAHKNFAVSNVATAPSPAISGTSLVVTAGHGTRFPAAPFNATIWPAAVQPDPSNAEVVRVTAISTDTLTITRAQEGSSAITVSVGDQIAATITDKVLKDAERVYRETRSSNTVLGLADSGKVIDTTATFTQTLTAAATLGDGWWVILHNDTDDGTTLLTVDPNGSETVDGLTTIKMYSGEARLIVCNGSNFFSQLLSGGFARFTADDNFIVPYGITEVTVDLIASGGSGAGGRGAAVSTLRWGGTGGGGGARVRKTFAAAALGNPGDTITVDVAAPVTGGPQNTNGTVGNPTTFGSLLAAYGGGPGFASTSGGTNNRTGGGGGGHGEAGGIGAENTASRGGGNSNGGHSGMGTAGGGCPVTVGGALTGSGSAEDGGGAGGQASGTGGAGNPGFTSFGGGGGGAAGGGVTSANPGTQSAGGVGGDTGTYAHTGGGGGAAGSAGTNPGTDGADGDLVKCGEGGGGGGSSNSGTGGAGGAGGDPGGGGGGGGGGTSTGGAGGDSGRGEARVWYS